MHKQSPRIMILTASYGDGHLQASRALQQRFYSHGIADVQIIDLMKEAHPFLNTITTKLYVKSTQTSKYGLDYYGWSYYMTRDTKHDGSWNKYLNYLGKKKLKEMILEERPDAIINTFPFGAAPELGRESAIPTFTVVTDYALHSRWIHPDVQKYYVATQELRSEMLAKGFDSEQIEISGIPVRQAFHKITAGRFAAPSRLDPAKKTVLIVAGSYGVLNQIEDMASSLLSTGKCQLAVVCGRNEKLQLRLSALFADQPDVHVFGFVTDIHELMARSSCIVTKAGGLTLSEALTLQLPIFIFKPFAGQEKENALFFKRQGMACVSYSAKELIGQIDDFLSDDAAARSMKSRMAAFRTGEAADFIVKDVLHTIEQKVLLSV